MKRLLLILSLPVVCTLTTAQTLTKYVNPLIGSGGHGHVFVGANVPFGFAQAGPTSIPQTWDWCSGYHRSDSTVIGFSQTHLSGTGIGDLFDVTIMPVTGKVTYARGEEGKPESGMWSYADRSREVARPGYYKTHLLRYDITAEMTASQRCTMYRFTFPESREAGIVVDLENGGCWDKATQTYVEQCSPVSLMGYRYSTGWAKNQRIYFFMLFSKPITSFEKVDERYCRVGFETGKDEQIGVKIGLSPTSMTAAMQNLFQETNLTEFDFDTMAQNAEKAWEKELSKIEVKTSDEQKKRIFYTALYHTMMAPALFCDIDKTYRGADGKVHTAANFTNYTVLSLWDTYRAAHPLMTLIHPERMADIVNTMLNIYQQQGKLPVWHLMGWETNTMVGNPAIPVVADAMLKGFGGFDKNLAYEAMRQSAMLDERGLKEYREHGYIPYEQGHENVSRTLEYGIADWALAQAAKQMGKAEDYSYFMKRSKGYRLLFDKRVGFVRGKSQDGTTWRTPFNPFTSTHEQDDFTEGNAWQYTWLVPHDVEGLVETFGGKRNFLHKFDSLFIVNGDLGADAPPDISGLIGQYAHGNEPSHHILYLYTMLGQPWKTADLVRKVLNEQYFDDYDGLSGNEDAGQMSAWYLLSSMGFYQVEPAGGRYVFGYPNFDEMSVNMGQNTLRIVVKNAGGNNHYIQRITLNGKPVKKYWIDHKELITGGTLEYTMGPKPKKWY
ncbi:MAG: GH92 family glycosyl hydrolase [Bacteroidaceae bacterium]|nr:GH92 family glycosyl hydrolase [Bacteroidaceae bacterium]